MLCCKLKIIFLKLQSFLLILKNLNPDTYPYSKYGSGSIWLSNTVSVRVLIRNTELVSICSYYYEYKIIFTLILLLTNICQYKDGKSHEMASYNCWEAFHHHLWRGGGGWEYNGHVLSQRVARTNLGLLHFLGAKVCQVFCEEFVFLQIFKHNNRTP